MSIMFSVKSGSDSFDVFQPSAQAEKWLITAEEKYRPNKEKFVYDKFIKDFPSIKAIDAQQVYALASRSSKLNEWLAKTNAEYSVIEGSPTFYRDYVDANEYDKASKEVLRINDVNARKAADQAAAALVYKNQLAEIDKKYNDQLLTDNKIAVVIGMSTTSLPLTIQLAIENYTPATSSAPNQKAFARECLINYKIALLKAIKNNPKIDINKLIIEQQEK